MTRRTPNPSADEPLRSATTLRELAGYLRPHRRALLLTFVPGLAAGACALAQPLATGKVIDAVSAGNPLTVPIIALVALFVAEATLSSLHGFLLARIGEGFVLRLRRSLVGAILHLPIAEHDRRRRGDLLSRVGSDTTLMRAVVTSGFLDGVAGALFLVAALVVLATLDLVLLGIVLGTLVLAGGVVLWLSVGIRSGTESAQEGVGDMTAGLERALGAIRTVKASRAEQRELDRISAQAESAYRAGVRVARLDALVEPATTLAAQGSFVLVLGVGGARVASGALSLGDFIAFLLYIFFITMPILMLFEAVTSLQKGIGALDRIRDLQQAAQAPGDPPRPSPREPVADDRGGAAIRFEHVSFAYRPDQPVLRDVSFAVRACSETAIVGPSGAGKSTLFALIERFYDVEAGRVLLRGVDVADIRVDALRARVGFVEQSAPVLAGTIRENLLYAAPDASSQAVSRVVELVNLAPTLARCPDGLDTAVGDAGVTLSGGERQRIAIGRALLMAPQVLLMDEPTSQLDAANERLLRSTMDRVAEKTTILVIAHRLSTVRAADQIVLLDEGAVRSVGSHEELVDGDPMYRDLAATQLLSPPASPDAVQGAYS